MLTTAMLAGRNIVMLHRRKDSGSDKATQLVAIEPNSA